VKGFFIFAIWFWSRCTWKNCSRKRF